MAGERQAFSFDHYTQLCLVLAQHISGAKHKPDVIIAIGRGGLLPGELLSRALEIPMAVMFTATDPDTRRETDYETAKHGITLSYSTASMVDWTQVQRILVVDDMSDRGFTFMRIIEMLPGLLKKYMMERRRLVIQTAAIFLKTGAQYEPTFWAQEVSSDLWIDQPTEIAAKSIAMNLRPPSDT